MIICYVKNVPPRQVFHGVRMVPIAGVFVRLNRHLRMVVAQLDAPYAGENVQYPPSLAVWSCSKNIPASSPVSDDFILNHSLCEARCA